VTVNDPFSVLAVCTGNLHRSVLTEHVLDAAARRRGLDWTVRSAGVAAVPGQPLDPRTEQVLRRARIPVQPHWTTRQVTSTVVGAADLILVAAHEHRREVAELDPAALPRVFLLRQFARLSTAVRASGAIVSSGPELVAAADAARSRLQPVPPGHDDITDPFGRSNRVLLACLRDIQAAVEQIVGVLGPAG
jgi:protein-tyrosine phosphatase